MLGKTNCLESIVLVRVWYKKIMHDKYETIRNITTDETQKFKKDWFKTYFQKIRHILDLERNAAAYYINE